MDEVFRENMGLMEDLHLLFKSNTVCINIKNEALADVQNGINKKSAVVLKKINGTVSSIIQHISNNIIEDDIIKDTRNGIITDIFQYKSIINQWHRQA